jgi:hypothetical protein
MTMRRQVFHGALRCSKRLGRSRVTRFSQFGSPDGGAPEMPHFHDFWELDRPATLVVGGYGGIGGLTSKLLAHHGARVAVAGRSLEKATALAEEITGRGGTATGIRIDLADRAHVRGAVDQVAEELGGLDIVVDLAVIELENRAEAVTEDEWAHVLGVDLSGAFWLSQAAARKMIERGHGGRIIHFFHPQRRRRQAGLRGLCRGERRPEQPDPTARDGMGSARHHRQRRRPGLHPHRADPGEGS